MSDPRITFPAIILLAAILTLYRLGSPQVCGFNEAVEGVAVQQMVEHGNLLFPLQNGRFPMYKPPLFHWTAVALDRAAGIRRVTEFNLRLPAAVYAIAGVALTLAFASSFLGADAAIIAGLILCGSYQYIENARIGRVDVTLAFCETLAIFSLAWWLAPRDAVAASDANSKAQPADATCSVALPEAERVETSPIPVVNHADALRYLFALALGLGVLAKGPVGAIVPVLACGIFLIMEHRYADLRRLVTPGPVLLAFALSGSWYVACLLGGRGSFVGRQLGDENLGRFFGTLGAMAPWYYVKPLVLNSVPFSLLAPVAVYFALRRPRPADQRPNSSSKRPRIAVRLCAIFWLVTVVFFSLAAYKRRAYLLPLWPASAVMLAWWIDVSASRLLRRAAVGLALVAAFAILIYLPRKEVRECATDSFAATAAQINRIVGPGEPLYSYLMGDEPAPLLFYLDRDAPPLSGKLGDAPPGYVVLPAAAWTTHRSEALDLTPVFESTSGAPRLVLLRRGKAYATR